MSQAENFNDPNHPCNVLVATDAIGMGLNLNIQRVIFHSMTKPTLLENGADQKTPTATEAPTEAPTVTPAETAVAETAAETPAASSTEQAVELPTPKEAVEPAPAEEAAASPQVAATKEVEATLEKIEPEELQVTAGAVAPAKKGGLFFSCCSPTVE